MEIDIKYKIPFNPLKLEVIELLDIQDIPILILERDTSGQLYLSYLVEFKDNSELRIVTAISQNRLTEIISGNFAIRDAFNFSETETIYFIEFDLEKGNPLETYLVPSHEFVRINPIDKDYFVQMPFNNLLPVLNKTELINYAIQKNKLIIDLYLKSEHLVNNVKPWAFNRVINPIVEIIKSFVEIDQRNIDRHIAYSNFRQSSLGVTIEVSHSADLFSEGPEAKKLIKLISLLNAETKEDLEAIIQTTKNEGYLKFYSRIIRTIIDKNASLSSAFVNPISREISESKLTKLRADVIKKIIDETLQEIIDIEEIEGYFLEIDIDISEPSFKIFSLEDDATLKGKIDHSLLEKLKNDKINIGKENYIFTVKTIYIPETTLKPEESKRYLIDYKQN